MKKELSPPQLTQPGTYEQVFREGEAVLLICKLRWPQLTGDGPGCRRINRYYDALADRWRRRWEGPLLAQAKAAAGADAPPWEATLDFTVTLFQEGCLSLYWEAVEQVGLRRPRRLRQGDVWLLPQGLPVTLRELLPPRRWWRGPVLEEVCRQIGRRVSAGEAVFYEDWPGLASRRFSPARFYLTPEGPAVFYPVESIAPAMEGFPTFSLASLLPPETLPEKKE